MDSNADVKAGTEKVVKEHISWQEFDYAVRELGRQMMNNRYHPDYIVGLARGGLPAAVCLSHIFGSVPVEAMLVRSYRKTTIKDGQQPESQGQLYTEAPKKPHAFYNSQNTLFIDDLWDTGHTMMHIAQEYPKAVKATVFHKSDVQYDAPSKYVHYRGLWKPKSNWLCFPWEMSHGDR